MPEKLAPKQIKDLNRKNVAREQAELLRQELKAGHREPVQPISEPTKQQQVAS